jgi:hypothetical protein
VGKTGKTGTKVKITADVQESPLFSDELGKFLQNCSFFELLIGYRLPFGKMTSQLQAFGIHHESSKQKPVFMQ